MPPRRPHSKSRLGCKQCKQRRVKCDERYPVCSNCERRDFDCSFQYSGPPPKKSVGIPTRAVAATAAASHDVDSDFPDLSSLASPLWSPTALTGPFSRAAELQLMHQWSVATYKSLSDTPQELQRSQCFVPELALKNPFLLDSLFSLSSLHLASLSEEEKMRYGDMAIAYQDRALTQFRSVLVNPQPEQGPAMYFASAFIGVITFTIPRVLPTNTSVGPTSNIIHMSRLFSGTAAVVDLCKRIMGEDEWASNFPEEPGSDSDRPPLASDILAALNRLKFLAAEADGRESGPSSSSASARYGGGGLYMNSVNELESCLKRITDDTGAVLSWPVAVGSEFNSRLESGDSMARLITMCYGLLLQSIDNKWWASGSGREVVDELSPWVAESNPQWVDIIDWVRMKVGLPPSSG